MSTADGVRLRPLRFDDWSRVHEWGSSDTVCRYQPWGPNTLAETQEFVRAAVDAWSGRPQTRYAWAAVTVDQGVVGMGDLRIRSVKWRQLDFGYVVHLDHWGQGIATAIARQITDFAFRTLGAHRVEATCDPRNLASARVLTKLGLTHEGRRRQVIELRDGWRDSDIYSILEHEWSAVIPAAAP